MTLTPEVRKFVVCIESVHHDGGPRVEPPLRKGVSAAVIANPYACRYEAQLAAWMEALRPLAVELTERLLESLRVGPESIQAFGKGALVGVDGEHESHFDAIDLTIADAPRPREIVFALAASTGGRVHARLGGLTAQQAEAGEGPAV